ncbi:hypothetical protein EVJ58_g749 [Rhodofomes roseus]|uniref:Uncharacterized protein n=1 Tax=Rhodofomes roseus TaxID=34475 RepID=A0A4Y9Z699_9APHY|nr:hypothetical protein EVJ58_g749 [Rhodofomes roseus]
MLDRVVFGLLQVSGTTPGILVVTTGTVCVIFSVTAVLYCEAFNAYLARADRHRSGWISCGVPDAEWSWRSVPMLLAVPAAHVCWATAVFIAFVMEEAWTGMGAQCANMSGDPSLSTRNIHIGGTTIICALVVTGQIVASVVQAAFVVPAFRQLCSSSEQTTDTV